MPTKLFILFFCSLACSSMFAQNITRDAYINRYKDIAISEMERSGIPASITIAQGILESGNGNSTLATKANNHFGIKCHKGWTGKGYYIVDDDRDAKGNLIKSCFRVYSDPYESYIDHTEFLVGRSRYAFLFEYEQTEFRKWAKGLKQAGYATNPKYPDLLIKIIVENELFRFDQPGNTEETDLSVDYPVKEEPIVIVIEEPIPHKPKVVPPKKDKPKKSFFPKKDTKGIFYNNDTKTIVAKKEDRSLALASKHKVPYHQFIKYNDLQPGDELMEGQYVYLKPKRVNFRGRKKRHVVREDESMYIVSQLYGIRLKALYRKNKMEKPEEPATYEKLAIRGKLKNKPRLRSRKQKNRTTSPGTNQTKTNELPVVISKPATIKKPKNIKVATTKNTPSSAPKTLIKPTKPSAGQAATSIPVSKPPVTIKPRPVVDKPVIAPVLETKPKVIIPQAPERPQTTQPASSNHSKIHIVSKGETLYSISRKYSVTVTQIKTLNNLSSNVISIDQKLLIE